MIFSPRSLTSASSLRTSICTTIDILLGAVGSVRRSRLSRFTSRFDKLVVHHQLLDVVEELGFSGDALEVVRRLLADSTCTVGEHLVDLLRGAPQGSPLSPFLAILYFESLARVVTQYVRANPRGALALFGQATPDSRLVLHALLQYADDTTLTSPSRSWLQGLLAVVGQWARARLLKFNASKSQALQLSRGRVQQPTDTDFSLRRDRSYPARA